MILALILVGVLGAAIGSFLNVVIHRVPLGLSVVSPASRCPSCGAPIRARHNLPVVGWLVLRGRCRDCGAAISVRYPLTELLTAAVFVLVTWRVVQLDRTAVLPALLVFSSLGIVLAAIDVALRRLPNVLVLPAYPAVALLLAGAAAVDHDWWALARAGLGAVALFAFFWALAAIHPHGMGFGDVKLAGLIGLVLGWFSWSALLVGAFTGFFLGAVVGVVVIAVGSGGRRTTLPFGPFMVLGALLALWLAGPVAALMIPA